MKKLFIFGAMALSLSIFISSCEKDEIKTDENTSDSLEENKGLVAKNNANPNSNAPEYFELKVPRALKSEVTIIKNEDLIGFDQIGASITEEIETDTVLITLPGKQGESVDGFFLFHHNTYEGKIVGIDASTNLRSQTDLNSASLMKFAKDGLLDDIIDDLIELAKDPVADCHMTCQDSYRENVDDCGDDSVCNRREWRMYKKCARGCTWQGFWSDVKDAFN